MKTIKDSVHSHIDIEGIGRDLLDTPPVQRLRRIRQLGTVPLVYPSANHTRFEHSIGVYHLADRALDHLPIHGKRANRLRAAALLHDIGHFPFSHNIEPLLERKLGRGHEEVSDLVERSAVGDVLRDHDINPQAVVDLIAGGGEYGDLISGELDVDRMDYLVRDAHHTGVPYGTIDHERLVRALTFIDGELVLSAGNVQTAESLLIARSLMNPTVYNHHVARISKAMLRRATERLLETTETTAETISRMDDPELRVRLRQCTETSESVRRIETRTLLKRAVWAKIDDIPQSIRNADHEQYRDWEQSIAERVNLDDGDVLLDVPPEPKMTESDSKVIVNDSVRRLDDESPLVETLREAQRAQWRLGVYAPADHVEEVGKAAAEKLGIDIETLVSEVRGMPATLDQFRD